MDPLSVTASVITVLGLVARVYDGLFHTLERISDGPKELEHHLIGIRALQATFEGILRLENEGLSTELLTPDFIARLQACIFDLQRMENLARKYDEQLKHGSKSKTWTRMRISLGDQRKKLNSQLRRIGYYHKTFSLHLLLLNARISLRTQSSLAKVERIVQSESGQEQNQRNILEGHGHCISSNRDPVPQATRRKYYAFQSMKASLWAGPVVPSREHVELSRFTTFSQRTAGYGVAVAGSWDLICPFRIEIALSILSRWVGSSVTLSLHWTASCPRIVPWSTSIFDFAARGDIQALQTAFEKRISSPFDVSPNGSTLLHIAAAEGNTETVRFLVDNGSRVNAMDDFGETPLHCALAICQDYDVSRFLIDNGADLSNRNLDGPTPLHTFYSPALRTILRNNGHDLEFSTIDCWGMSVLHYMAWSSKTPAELFESYYDEKQANMIGVDSKGRSLLHLAAQRGNRAIVGFLLSHSQKTGHYIGSQIQAALDYAKGSKREQEIRALLWEHETCLQTRSGLKNTCLRFRAQHSQHNVQEAEVATSSDVGKNTCHQTKRSCSGRLDGMPATKIDPSDARLKTGHMLLYLAYISLLIGVLILQTV